ncbi:SMEK domain-containing protein [Pseudomonas sp. QTF5]|uniref:SMEK domain-containing protein n=1 Tax=Pseudomonas sp. QTF5 TaxID=1435425 RepID=UPI0006869EC3|nr:SMEK domain-containing protein [Pseudomonas sp. QTF5]
MLKHGQLIKEITLHITHLSASIEVLGTMHFFDLNIAAEHFFQRLLNQVYGYNLVNLNHSQLNAAAIDLADQNISLAVQVTSDRRAPKIQKTLDKFVKHGLGTTYKSLKILLIGKRTGTYSTVTVPSGVVFDGRADVIDNKSLMQDIEKKTTSELQAILALIESEISYDHTAISILDKTDADALSDIRDRMDRPALQDPWHLESDYRAFGDTITGLIETINTGRSDGQLVTKPRFKYQDPTLIDQLNILYNQLRALRLLFRTHVQSGEINLIDNVCNFRLSQTAKTFDSHRNLINAEFNSIGAQYNLAPLLNVS